MPINLSQLRDDEKLFLSRLSDLFELSRDKYNLKFTGFLDERQIDIALEYARQNRFDNFLLYGGYEDAQRLVLGVFPPTDEPNESAFPITPVTLRYPENAILSHRDFLGSLMALKITRESIGDILVSGGRCDLFALTPVSHIILDELKKVGSVGVKTAAGVPGDFVVSANFESMRSTISSPRIDSLVSALTKLSREKASALIKQGLVKRNFTVVENGAREFSAGDTVSIRGFGKYIVDEIGAPTKKGRLPVMCRRYV